MDENFKNISIPIQYHKKLKVLAAVNETSISSLICEGIDYVLDKHEASVVITDGKITIREFYEWCEKA